ncbi:MAG: hypothetical protein M1840_006046 [Geoglossum simile]|nr:MAG: hypothetical protein M1840_006046 [Geoglossum simile]
MASNRASYETRNGGSLRFEGLPKDEASKKGSKEDITLEAAEGERKESGHPGKEDPFGNEEDSDVKYRTMAWWHAAMLMIAETISLGILSLPSALATVGLVPGIILIISLGLAATYTGYVIGQFKIRYPHVHNMADAGEVLLGAVGREVFGFAQITFLIFVMASHILTFSIMLNVLSSHGTCTIVFNVIGMVVSIVFTLPRTLKNVSYFSIASFISVATAVLITMIGVAVWKQGDGTVRVSNSTSLYKGFLAVTNIVFAYAGHVTFFGFISEMKKPKDYPKALIALQFADTTMYVIAAAVIYRFAGDGVTSPALGSTSPVLKKVAWGVAIPTIVISGVINGHVAVKYIYVRIFRGTKHIGSGSPFSRLTWVFLTILLWFIAWIIAEAIPVFNNLLGLVSSLFASWFTYGLSGFFWLFMNYGLWFSSPKKMALTALNCLMVIIAIVICGLGLYSSIQAIRMDPGSGSFSCASNAV